MNIRAPYLFGLFIILILLGSCTDPAQKSYYYWRSTYQLNAVEEDALAKSGMLYVKVCDVVTDGIQSKPVAVTIWEDKPLPNVKYVPVVFIDKDIFIKNDAIDTSKISREAGDVFRLIQSAWEYNSLSFDEIQIDCDWTPRSQERYFIFLQALKKVSQIKITATLRLDQIKNHKITGIPPVDEGVVMAYNMGNLSKVNTDNSILSMSVLKQYINSKTNYPLPAKLALPIFTWKLLYRDANFKGILSALPDSLLQTNFTTEDEIRYSCNTSFVYNEIAIEQGDIIRNEKVSNTELTTAEKYIRQNMNLKEETIYFDLSTKNIQSHE